MTMFITGKRRLLLTTLSVLFILGCSDPKNTKKADENEPASVSSDPQTKNNIAPLKPAKSGYAPVNGLKIYYEVYGQGTPLVLLHGLYTPIGLNWSQVIPELSKTRKVIALEMQGHGRTADADRPLSYPLLANDVAGVMKYLKVDSADILGYSFGGSIAYALAIHNPELVKKLIVVSSTYKYEGWQLELRNMLKMLKPEFFDTTIFKEEYKKIAPDTAHFQKFVSKMIAFDNTPFNLGEENLKSIKAPVLLITGDNDGVDKPVLAETFKLLGGGVVGDINGIPKARLAIIPGTTHASFLIDMKIILPVVNAFLNSPATMPPPNINQVARRNE